MDPNRLCMGCMKEVPEKKSVCPHCGFDAEAYERERSGSILPLYSVLRGQYLIGKMVGQGGFGITYMGWHLGLQMKIAVKEYFPLGLSTRDTSKKDKNALSVNVVQGEAGEAYQKWMGNFEKEARMLAGFSFPGIVQIHDTFRENSTAYIVMDYVEGRNLKEWMRKKNGVFSEREALEAIAPVLNALEKLHQKSVIHRDISPDNIMIDEEGTATLIDFGAARYLQVLDNNSMSVMLKHGYAPPEQYSRNGDQGAWTDIYALCATLVYMITGSVPEDAIERMELDPEDDEKALKTLLSGKVSRQTEQALLRGLVLKKEKRIREIRQLKKELLPDGMQDEGKGSGKKQNAPLWIVGSTLAVLLAFAGGLIGGGLLKPSKRTEPVSSDQKKMAEYQLSTGDMITLGCYEQDNDPENGAEPIEWEVMEVQDGRVYLWSREVLDCRPFHETADDVTWEDCTLRSWLQEEFFPDAFSEEEQEVILTVDNSNPENPEFGTGGGASTLDRIFLPSVEEVMKFYSLEPYVMYEPLAKAPTEYCLAAGIWILDEETAKDWGREEYGDHLGDCDYWLRTAGDQEYRAATIYCGGGISLDGLDVNETLNGVRPAIWADKDRISIK